MFLLWPCAIFAIFSQYHSFDHQGSRTHIGRGLFLLLAVWAERDATGAAGRDDLDVGEVVGREKDRGERNVEQK